MKVIYSLLLLAPCLSALMISCCKYFLITVKLRVLGFLYVAPCRGNMLLCGDTGRSEVGEDEPSLLGFLRELRGNQKSNLTYVRLKIVFIL